MRLAFAVAINVDADILLIDEALAVGDIFFRQKCYKRLNQLKKEGKTIVLVSHGMNEVEQFCDRALLLNKGDVIELGSSRDVVKKYYILDVGLNHEEHSEVATSNNHKQSEELNENDVIEFEDWKLKDDLFYDLSDKNEIGNEKTHITKVGLFDEQGNVKRVFTQGEWAYFYAEVEVIKDIDVPLYCIVI